MEISGAMKQLSARTLLFLRHIKEIIWNLPDNTYGVYLRDKPRPVAGLKTSRYVDIIDGGKTETWIVFERKSKVADEGKEHQVTVEVAFSIQDDKVVRAHNTELVVFFPTAMKTELGFLIQGPFKTTKARNNIDLECEANKQLVITAAQLAADSLENLRDLGLLDVESFNVLPLCANDFPKGSFFRPIYDAVREKLKTCPLLPKHGGGFVSAGEALLSDVGKLVDLFSSKQLVCLFAKESALYWLDTAITADRMPDLRNYLVGKRKTQYPNEWEQEPLIAGIKIETTAIANKLTTEFFQAQDESWLVRFYAYLEQNYSAFQNTPFVRLERGQHVSPGPFSSPKAYLPPADAADIDQNIFPLVKQTFAKNPIASRFLRDTAKLREPDKIDVVIRCLLPKYDSGNLTFRLDTYVHDLKSIADAYAGVRPDDAKRLVEELKKRPFVAVVPANNPKGAVIMIKPGDSALYRQSLELEHWFAGNQIDPAWFPLPVVDELLPANLKVLLGYCTSPLIKRSFVSSRNWDSNHQCYRRPEGGFDADADIVGLEWATSNSNQERAIYLWNRLLERENINLIKGKELRGGNRQFPVGSYEEFNDFSVLGKRCTVNTWLIKQDDQDFHRPAVLYLSDLANEFEKDTPRAKSFSLALGMKQPEHEQALEFVTGGDPEFKMLIEHYQSASDVERKKLLKTIPREIQPEPAPSFKDGLKNLIRLQRGAIEQVNREGSPVSNPDRYQNKLDERVESGVEEHQSTTRKITFTPMRDLPSNVDARRFLYEQYHGRCQVTGTTFPKASKNADGAAENYFEACSLLSYANADYLNDAGNMLCVSADTMAKFMVASREFLESLEEAIEIFKANGEMAESMSVKIRLAGEECSIKWNQRHFMRLVALYENA